MKKRKITTIDEDKCDGCGRCIPNCPEGALQVIDGKARLVSDLLCDGLGACLGECPRGAIRVEERAAEEYDERKVMANMVKRGVNTVKAHLKHLKDHGQREFLEQAAAFLKENGIKDPSEEDMNKNHKAEGGGGCGGGCPGSREMSFDAEIAEAGREEAALIRSGLRQWPVQLHLVSPSAPYFKNADLVLAADCTAYAYGNFHNKFLKGKALIIACPKLDEGQESYVEKLGALINDAKVNTLTVLTMEVPCCMGLLSMVRLVLRSGKRKVPVKHVMIGIKGGIISEEWLSD